MDDSHQGVYIVRGDPWLGEHERANAERESELVGEQRRTELIESYYEEQARRRVPAVADGISRWLTDV